MQRELSLRRSLYNTLPGLTFEHNDAYNADYVDSLVLCDVSIDRNHNGLRELKSKTTTGYTMQGLYEVSAAKE
ncbi:MAG: hypothetical protein I3J02_07860, partial [Prevotella sp.]|nr:hypothetical protein [Prevotella sp.]